MSTKKLKRRIDRVAELLLQRGIGTFCECPHPDGVEPSNRVLSKLLDGDWEPEQLVECAEHRPRPLKSKGDSGAIWLRLLPTFAETNALEPDSARKSASTLKPSRFDMSEYQLEN